MICSCVPLPTARQSGSDREREEGACGCAASAAPAEAERSRLLLTLWLGWRDSNPLYRSQSPVCYHYTTSQHVSQGKRPAAPPASSLVWGGIWGSNPRHPEPQSGALPTELIPPYQLYRNRIWIRRSDDGTPRGIRTPDLLLRRQLLYPAELLAHMQPSASSGAGDGNRTHVSSLEGWCSTIELHPHGRFSLEIIPYSNGSCQLLF